MRVVPRRRLSTPALALALALAAASQSRPALAQTGFAPYYGKNNIHYDTFDWHIYTTEHFEIYYYPEIQPQLERIASYAESAYQQISADLRHDLPYKVPMVLFKTHSEFEEQNIDPGAATEGVGAFAEPTQHRVVLPIDSPSDELYGLIVHELTHQFEYDIVPQSLIHNNLPLWFYEGLSDYERGIWDPIDLMMVRDAAVADIVPKMTKLEGYGDTGNPRLVYNLGHAVFEFIEARWGKDGLRNYLFALRKSVIGGGEDAYQEALQMSKEEFDQAFDRYLKDCFRPFRDKERPADYGIDLSPNQEKTKFAEALSIAPSPSGDLIAVVTINRKDQEIDIVLVSSKDGSIVRNLTAGFDKDMGFDHVIQMGEEFEMPWVAWSPKGDRLAYFVRTEKERTLIVQNVLTRQIENRVPIKTVDEPQSPTFSPDGRTIAFAGLREGIGNIFTVDLATQTVTNVTNDNFADFGPTYAPDGSYLIYNARISGNQKLFRLDLATSKKTQITFGTHDDTAAQFIDPHTIVFSSTATDPSIPVEPAVARNGNIYNVWTLDLNTGELRQYTDALGGDWSPVVLKSQDESEDRIAFVTYYKNEYSVRTLVRKEPLHTVASSDFGQPGPLIDFQPPLSEKLVPTNERKKGTFEKMFLDGRPPVSIGVTSNGDVFGGTQLTFSDVLGDKQFNFYVSSIAQYRTMMAGFTNLSHRLQWAAQGFSETQFFYGQLGGVFYDPTLAPFISRSDAIATRTVRGGTIIGVYPIDRYRRIEMSGSVVQLNEQYSDSSLQNYLDTAGLTGQQQVFRNGTLAPLSVAFVQETTIFREYGPLAGNTMRFSYDAAPKIGSLLSRQSFSADVRHYLRIGSNGVLATRVNGFKSIGAYPDFQYFGGNSEMRGYDYLSFVGQNILFANAELRFPIIEAALTPIGVVGGVRGEFFADLGAGWFDNTGFKFWTSKPETVQKYTGLATDANGNLIPDPVTGLPAASYEPVNVSGFRLRDARASYGVGLETFALGFPIHFDWSWRTLFNKGWEDVVYADSGGSAQFRKPRFAVWVGYDF